MGKRHTIGAQLVNRRGDNVGISESTNGVKTLLVGAVPQDIWSLVHGGSLANSVAGRS